MTAGRLIFDLGRRGRRSSSPASWSSAATPSERARARRRLFRARGLLRAAARRPSSRRSRSSSTRARSSSCSSSSLMLLNVGREVPDETRRPIQTRPRQRRGARLRAAFCSAMSADSGSHVAAAGGPRQPGELGDPAALARLLFSDYLLPSKRSRSSCSRRWSGPSSWPAGRTRRDRRDPAVRRAPRRPAALFSIGLAGALLRRNAIHDLPLDRADDERREPRADRLRRRRRRRARARSSSSSSSRSRRPRPPWAWRSSSPSSATPRRST